MSPGKRLPPGSAQAQPTPNPKDPKDVLKSVAPKSSLARIPSPARFFLVFFGSLVLSSVLLNLSAGFTQGDLGLVSKHLEEWWEVGGLIAWKGVEIALAWLLGFDMIPFALLRRPTSVHDLSHAPSGTVANRAILQDRPTTIYTTLAATSIFSVIMYASYASWLPAKLVVHFEDIKDISAAHAGPAGLPILFLTLLPAGIAARDFLFVSSTGHKKETPREADQSASREGEYLVTAVYRKTWGQLSTKSKILLSRTILLATGVLVNTIVQVAGTIRSVSIEGAATWGLVWAVATGAVGATFGWIEAVDGL
ncbi:hypothetical protein PENSUB_8724 [Penicillium subrubescens]|uniref:Uncharacterized protein n=1 Tax=Penicillium subrubescens TaxID=1316194 RepID=A0A1Q5TGG6_9EURO|nr:hypothetical protein PENSUB_8724 [Penicillium subrubescens]